MQKRAQFYLVAAIVIIGLIVGVTTIYNSSKKSTEDKVIFDITKELNYETLKVVDRGVFNALTPQQITDQVRNLSQIYSNLNPESDLLIAYGNFSLVTISSYINKNLGTINIELSPTLRTRAAELEAKGIHTYSTAPSASGELNVKINNDTYPFTIKQGQNFYLVMKKQIGGEQIVAQ